MPLYEYACARCSSEFELLIRGEEKACCPSCGRSDITRLVSVPAVHSRGGSQSLPVCREETGPGCGPGFCRTGQCQFD